MIPHKAEPHRTHITIGGKRICYPGEVVTLTGSLELIKLTINSVVSQRDAWLITFDIKKSTWKCPWGTQNVRASSYQISCRISLMNMNSPHTPDMARSISQF